jgi:predicted nucleotidyltransferase
MIRCGEHAMDTDLAPSVEKAAAALKASGTREPGEQLRSLLAELRSRFKALYGPRLVRLMLFGSQARGDAEPGSDIDVLVVLEGPVRPGKEIARTGEITAGMSLENNVVISCTFISADQFEREESPLMINVRREGVPV